MTNEQQAHKEINKVYKAIAKVMSKNNKVYFSIHNGNVTLNRLLDTETGRVVSLAFLTNNKQKQKRIPLWNELDEPALTKLFGG